MIKDLNKLNEKDKIIIPYGRDYLEITKALSREYLSNPHILENLEHTIYEKYIYNIDFASDICKSGYIPFYTFSPFLLTTIEACNLTDDYSMKNPISLNFKFFFYKRMNLIAPADYYENVYKLQITNLTTVKKHPLIFFDRDTTNKENKGFIYSIVREILPSEQTEILDMILHLKISGINLKGRGE